MLCNFRCDIREDLRRVGLNRSRSNALQPSNSLDLDNRSIFIDGILARSFVESKKRIVRVAYVDDLIGRERLLVRLGYRHVIKLVVLDLLDHLRTRLSTNRMHHSATSRHAKSPKSRVQAGCKHSRNASNINTERIVPKLCVVGSIPIARSRFLKWFSAFRAARRPRVNRRGNDGLLA